MTFTLESRLPTPAEFIALRGETAWGTPSLATAEAAMGASLCGAVAIKDGQTVGVIRAVGDGVINTYIQDAIVKTHERGSGIGAALVNVLLSTLRQQCPADCTIGLFAAKGQSAFYDQFGFIARPNADFGPGMHRALTNLVNPNLAKAYGAA